MLIKVRCTKIETETVVNVFADMDETHTISDLRAFIAHKTNINYDKISIRKWDDLLNDSQKIWEIKRSQYEISRNELYLNFQILKDFIQTNDAFPLNLHDFLKQNSDSSKYSSESSDGEPVSLWGAINKCKEKNFKQTEKALLGNKKLRQDEDKKRIKNENQKYTYDPREEDMEDLDNIIKHSINNDQLKTGYITKNKVYTEEEEKLRRDQQTKKFSFSAKIEEKKPRILEITTIDQFMKNLKEEQQFKQKKKFFKNQANNNYTKNRFYYNNDKQDIYFNRNLDIYSNDILNNRPRIYADNSNYYNRDNKIDKNKSSRYYNRNMDIDNDDRSSLRNNRLNYDNSVKDCNSLNKNNSSVRNNSTSYMLKNKNESFSQNDNNYSKEDRECFHRNKTFPQDNLKRESTNNVTTSMKSEYNLNIDEYKNCNKRNEIDINSDINQDNDQILNIGYNEEEEEEEEDEERFKNLTAPEIMMKIFNCYEPEQPPEKTPDIVEIIKSPTGEDEFLKLKLGSDIDDDEIEKKFNINEHIGLSFYKDYYNSCSTISAPGDSESVIDINIITNIESNQKLNQNQIIQTGILESDVFSSKEGQIKNVSIITGFDDKISLHIFNGQEDGESKDVLPDSNYYSQEDIKNMEISNLNSEQALIERNLNSESKKEESKTGSQLVDKRNKHNEIFAEKQLVKKEEANNSDSDIPINKKPSEELKKLEEIFTKEDNSNTSGDYKNHITLSNQKREDIQRTSQNRKNLDHLNCLSLDNLEFKSSITIKNETSTNINFGKPVSMKGKEFFKSEKSHSEKSLTHTHMHTSMLNKIININNNKDNKSQLTNDSLSPTHDSEINRIYNSGSSDTFNNNPNSQQETPMDIDSNNIQLNKWINSSNRNISDKSRNNGEDVLELAKLKELPVKIKNKPTNQVVISGEKLNNNYKNISHPSVGISNRSNKSLPLLPKSNLSMLLKVDENCLNDYLKYSKESLEKIKKWNSKAVDLLTNIPMLNLRTYIGELGENFIFLMKRRYRILYEYKENTEKINEYKFLINNFYNIIDRINMDELFNISQEKINFVFDIDNTILHALQLIYNNENIYPLTAQKRLDGTKIHPMSIDEVGRTYHFTFAFRKNIKEYLLKFQKYSNFFINTKGLPIYAQEIVKRIWNEFGIKFSSSRIAARDQTNQKKVLSGYPEYSTDPEKFKKNLLIFDDRTDVWDEEIKPYIINSHRFLHHIKERRNEFERRENDQEVYFPWISVYLKHFPGNNDEGQNLKISDAIERINDNLPTYVELISNGPNQVQHLMKITERIFKITFLHNKLSTKFVVSWIKSTIFFNVKFHVDNFLPENNEIRRIPDETMKKLSATKKIIAEIIVNTGGKITDLSEAEYCVLYYDIPESNLKNYLKNKKIVNHNFIISSLFNFQMMDHKHDSYRMLMPNNYL